jgi:hypothetical protein
MTPSNMTPSRRLIRMKRKGRKKRRKKRRKRILCPSYLS